MVVYKINGDVHLFHSYEEANEYMLQQGGVFEEIPVPLVTEVTVGFFKLNEFRECIDIDPFYETYSDIEIVQLEINKDGNYYYLAKGNSDNNLFGLYEYVEDNDCFDLINSQEIDSNDRSLYDFKDDSVDDIKFIAQYLWVTT